MNVYKIKIKKPFDYDDPTGDFKTGDVGIYSKRIEEAVKNQCIVEVVTPKGVFYADPRRVKRGKHIFRYYLQDKPMLLYIVTPKYNNRSDFEEKPTDYNRTGLQKLIKAWELSKKTLHTK